MWFQAMSWTQAETLGWRLYLGACPIPTPEGAFIPACEPMSTDRQWGQEKGLTGPGRVTKVSTTLALSHASGK